MADRLARLSGGVAGGALLIGAVTIVSRIVGFGRNLVLARTVGTDCLNTAYMTANYLPTITFEIVAGGALLGMVVPVLSGHLNDRRAVGQITSALLTWVLLILIPLAVLLVVAAGPIVRFMVSEPAHCDVADVVALGTRMLVIFAPQLALYGVAVVLYGVLNAYRRFLGPQLAPLVSTLVVIAAYLAFYPLSGGTEWDRNLSTLPTAAELTLAIGTTLGVAALVVTVLGPVRRLGLRIRPTLRFPDGVVAEVRRLALAGVAALIAQQGATLVVIVLANRFGGSGMLPAYNYAWALYQVPYAVLAIPIATSAFPSLSGRHKEGDAAAFDDLTAKTTRAVVLVTGAAAGVLAALAVPVGTIFLHNTDTAVSPSMLALGVAAFSPGLVGYGLMFHLSRVLYACGRSRSAAAGQVAGWLTMTGAQTLLAATVTDRAWLLGGLGLGSTIGMTTGGLALLLAVRRARGRTALLGLPRALIAAVAGGGAAFAAGYAVVAAFGSVGTWESVGVAAAGGVASGAAFAAAALLIDGRDLRAVLRRGYRRSSAS